MKSLFLTAAFVALFSSQAFAGTRIFKDGRFMRAVIGDDGDAGTLYEVLQLKAVAAGQTLVKTFRTSDGKLEINCTKSEHSSGTAYGCILSVDTQKSSSKSASRRTATTLVSSDDGVLRARVRSLLNRDNLYVRLDVEELTGYSGFTRIYQTEDHKAEIYCTKSNKVATTCTVSMAIPEAN